MSTYSELLRDPRWQRKRLEVMNRADFKCEGCGADDKTFNVHHRVYRKGAKPWEYEDDELVCLCERCHLQCHSILEAIGRLLDRLTIDQRIDVLVHIAQLAKKNGDG